MFNITIGILHPGEMGAAVGAAAAANVNKVIWASSDRSEKTAAQAAAARLEDVKTLDELVKRCELIVSVCPPHAAEDVAGRVIDAGFQGVYLDANAISPQRAQRIADAVGKAGADFVDGGIIGPPPQRSGTTRLYLSGPSSHLVAQYFVQSPLAAVVLPRPVGAASALKMAFGAYTKGVTALVASILALATREGVREDLLREWESSQPGLVQRASVQVRDSARKAWRFIGEMEEVTNTFVAAGLPGGFHQAAAEVFQRFSHYRDESSIPPVEELIAELIAARTV